MKITIEENKQQRSYPYLGKNESGNIVAFTAPKTGVVVLVGSTTKWEQGEVLDVWNESAFTPMHPQPEPIPVEDRTYPYVGKSKQGNVVYFTKKGMGMLLERGTSIKKIGLDIFDWDEKAFTPIPVSQIIIDLE